MICVSVYLSPTPTHPTNPLNKKPVNHPILVGTNEREAETLYSITPLYFWTFFLGESLLLAVREAVRGPSGI